jgi:hypothetical protein
MSPTLVALIMDAIVSSGTSVLEKTRRRNIPEDGNFQNTYNRKKIRHAMTFQDPILAFQCS